MGRHFDSCVQCSPGININKAPASVLVLMQLFLHSCGTNSVNAKEQGMKENTRSSQLFLKSGLGPFFPKKDFFFFFFFF